MENETNHETDFIVENHGSSSLVRPITEAAKEHFEELDGEYRFIGTALAVEHRFIHEVVEQIREQFTVA